VEKGFHFRGKPDRGGGFSHCELMRWELGALKCSTTTGAEN
jgi:hypothetical protein